jgi:hypothetical protein
MIRQNWREAPLSEPDSPVTQAMLGLADAVIERMKAGGLTGEKREEDCEDCP